MNYIDKIFYINLDERFDRKKIMEDQFKKFNITNFERVSAIKPKYNEKYDLNFIDNQIEKYLNNKTIVNDLINGYDTKYILGFDKNYIRSKPKIYRRKYILGALGCKMSHIKAYKMAKNYNNVLILEDDALLHNNFIEYFEKLVNNIKNINYDMVWLAPNWLYKNNNGILNRCYSYKFINENFALVNSSISVDNRGGSSNNAAGILVSKSCVENILSKFENSHQCEIDLWFRVNYQTQNKVYTTIPNLVSQRIEESSIENFKVNYDKDIHYRTRQKFNIFSIVNENEKDMYISNLKNNLQKMIGYEKIYYISNKKLFNNDILHYININDLEDNIDVLKNNFGKKVNDNNIKYFYYMEPKLNLNNNYFPFDENNNLINNHNFYIK